MKPLPRWILPLAVAVVGTAACRPTSPEPTPEPPADPGVIAVYTDGQVTAVDLDRAVLELPAAQRRPAPDQSQADWHAGLVRELVLDQILLAEAELAGSDEDPEVLAAQQEVRRQTLTEFYIEQNRPPTEGVTEADIRRYYDQHPEDYDRAGRRLVLHLFKRRIEGQPIADLKEQVVALRQRAINGESFAALAAAHSDSESRHQHGGLGWMTREKLSPELAEVIFSLSEGVPSEPLVTAEGVHLFQVEKAVMAKRFSYEDAKATIGHTLRLEQSRGAVDQLAAELPLPPGSFVAEAEELAALFAAGDPTANVLRIGDYQLTAGRFRNLAARSLEQLPRGQQPSADFAPQLLRHLERRERIYLHAVAQGLAEEPEVAERLAHLERRVLLGSLRQRGLRRHLNQQPERLQRYYEDNKLRFSSPLRLEVRRLTVPISSATADRTMSRLEQAASGPGTAAERLQAAAKDLGGEIEDLGWHTQGELARLDPRWVHLAADLAADELSSPLSGESAIEVLEVVSRREPEPLPFATVVERVQTAYLDNRRQELYREWVDQRLDESGLEIFKSRLEGQGVNLPGTEATPAVGEVATP